jgi:hypothetical protein
MPTVFFSTLRQAASLLEPSKPKTSLTLSSTAASSPAPRRPSRAVPHASSPTSQIAPTPSSYSAASASSSSSSFVAPGTAGEPHKHRESNRFRNHRSLPSTAFTRQMQPVSRYLQTLSVCALIERERKLHYFTIHTSQKPTTNAPRRSIFLGMESSHSALIVVLCAGNVSRTSGMECQPG